ncbi:MAG: hypothetical protein JSS60_06690 [Verrucomicrobia bacterium]|nr:hypothetical protein [Verrucomicrobiota bacterium]
MAAAKITAVISFCSNDWRFLKRCVDGVSPFCQEILITVCDHFFDGSSENYALLEEAYRRFPHCKFLEFAFDPNESWRAFSPLYPEHPDWRHEWHNTGRWLGFLYSSSKTDNLFFLDCDEIVDSQRFLDWMDSANMTSYSAYRFAGLWHFREAKYVADTYDDLSLLVNKSKLHSSFLWDEDERCGLFQHLAGEKKKSVKALDGLPMIRHFSGVRTKEEWMKKLSSWGHHWERDWTALVEEEFSRPFNGEDFIRRYHYNEINAPFDPLLEEVPVLNKVTLKEHLKGLHRFPNVIMVNREESFRKELEHDFALVPWHDH